MGDHGDEWELQRIGTESEKSSVEKELAELRERLAKVEEWKARRQEIEDELNKVWVGGGEELPPPVYVREAEAGSARDEVDSAADEAESSFGNGVDGASSSFQDESFQGESFEESAVGESEFAEEGVAESDWQGETEASRSE